MDRKDLAQMTPGSMVTPISPLPPNFYAGIANSLQDHNYAQSTVFNSKLQMLPTQVAEGRTTAVH